MSLFDWINLGKHARSPFGKWLDRHGITQQEIAKESGVSKSTISRLCQPEEHEPTMKTARKLLVVMRRYDANATYEDYWR